jgi:hypothetical protein
MKILESDLHISRTLDGALSIDSDFQSVWARHKPKPVAIEIAQPIPWHAAGYYLQFAIYHDLLVGCYLA